MKESALLSALSNIAITSPTDPHAALWVAYIYQQASDMFLFIPQLIHTKPTVNPPAIFKNFTDIPNIGSTFKVTPLTGHVLGTNGGYNFRCVSVGFLFA